jgi:hypothetical protein
MIKEDTRVKITYDKKHGFWNQVRFPNNLNQKTRIYDPIEDEGW